MMIVYVDDKEWVNPQTGVRRRVDSQLDPDWLNSANTLGTLFPTSICAGHADAPGYGSSQQRPTMRFDLKPDLYPDDAGLRAGLGVRVRAVFVNNINAGTTLLRADWTDVLPVTFHIVLNSRQARRSVESEQFVNEWFETTLQQLRRCDQSIQNQTLDRQVQAALCLGR